MKKLLRLSSLLVTAVLLAFSSQKSYASHYQGSDMTYACIAPNVYVVTMKLYRDCTGATAPTSAQLNLKSPGCNAGRNVTMTKIGTNKVGDPYCPSIPKTCNTSSVNYEEVVFKATVTFSAAEAQCADWIFSWSECCRPSIENLASASSFSLYSEAMVKLFSTATPNNIVHNNSSPEFASTNVPIPFVCVNEEITYSLNAAEVDGDSLSYHLVQPLDGPTTPIAYSAIQGQGQTTLFNPNPLPPYNTIPFGQPGSNQQFAVFLGAGASNYSATYPISSFNVNWNAINPTTGIPYNPVVAQKYFLLDSLSGQLKFRPGVFNAGTTPAAGRNKYAVVVKIKEWRKINGVMVNIGYVRRDILFIVVDCSGNKPPVSTPVKPPQIVGATINDTVFKVQTCTTTRIKLNYTDLNATDKLTVTFAPNAAAAIPNGNLQIFDNGTSKVRAYLDITPLPSDVGKQYFINAKLEDDACPIKGVNNYVYRIEVVATNRVSILDDTITICQGQTLPITAVRNRPDSILGNLADYKFKWQPAPGLNPNEENSQTINVTPTQDTWYRVTLRNASLNGCFDYDSILVRVNPNPTVKEITVTNPLTKAPISELKFGRSAQLTTILDNPTAKGLKYSWSPTKGLSDSTIANPIADPLVTTEYTLTVTTEDGLCEAEKTVTVKVGPFFLPNVITPNNDGKNDVFEYKGIQPNTSLKIYSRWGVLIKEYSSYDNSFKGEGVSDGTYYYIMQEPNGGKSYKGWFDIVRD